jgi:glycosyltransferase involved in cell wall biosynthesis
VRRQTPPREPRVAVLIPCYNEAITIEKVVRDFRAELPDADIYVYDNNSTDETADLAQVAGAMVRTEKKQGKGFVIRSMFRDVDADVYVMVDGDDTYPADQVRDLIRPVVEGRADMVVGNRLARYGERSFRPLHVFGNHLVVRSINAVFWSRVEDVMSGYRAFSREFVKSVPVVSRGFEVETELTLQALYRDFVIREVPIQYGERPEGSHSKLQTYRDGARVLLKILDICKAYRPLLFFSVIAIFLALLGLALGTLPIFEFLTTGTITLLPSAILASALEVIAVVTVVAGLVLDSIKHHFREQAELVLVREPSRRRRRVRAREVV